MMMEMTATVENGVLKPDQELPFPEHSRVRLTIENEWDAERAREAWKQLKNLMVEQPITSGLRFTRDELYERD
jgi:predicted DNA-binding antitoxin AbrB/MazE fold protein